MEFLKPGTSLAVHAYKKNGELYRRWENVKVLAHDRNKIILVNHDALITKQNGKRWKTRDPAIWFFQTGRWSNIICMLKPNGIGYYVNIASPFIFEDGVIKYIDYDLDIRVFPNGTYSIVDVNEFHDHRIKFGYSQDLIKLLWQEVDLIEEEVKKNKSIFKHKAVFYYLNLWQKIKNPD